MSYTRAQVRGEFRFIKYQQGQRGAQTFADNFQVPEGQAIRAVLSVLPIGTSQGRTDLQSGSWDHVPFGVSYQSDGDNAAHFNSKKDAKNNGQYTPVGLLPGPAAPHTGIVDHMRGHGFKISFDDSGRLQLWVFFHTAGFTWVSSQQVQIRVHG